MRILILGHFGGYNLGDDAMLYSFLNEMNNKDKGHHYDIITKNGNLDYPKIKSVFPNIHLHTANPLIILRLIIASDIVILCGGTHYHDDYGQLRLKKHIRYLRKFNYVFRLTKLLKNRVYIVANGFGPIQSKEVIGITEKLTLLADNISVRDKFSAQLLNDKFGTKVTCGSDLAFLLGPFIETKKEENLVGVSVMNLQPTSFGSEKLTQGYVNQVFESIFTGLRENSKMRVNIFEIRGGGRESDSVISKQLFKDLTKTYPRRVKFIEYQDDPVYMLNEINKCSLFVCTRFHSAVLSLLSDCKIIMLAYHKKLLDLAKDIDLDSKFIIDLSDFAEFNMIEKRLKLFLQEGNANNQSINRDNLYELKKAQIQFIHQLLNDE